MQRCSRADRGSRAGWAAAAAAVAVAAAAVVAVVEVVTEVGVGVEVEGTGWPAIAFVDAAVATATAAESVEDHGLGGQSAQLGQHARRGHHACSDPLGPQLVG